MVAVVSVLGFSLQFVQGTTGVSERAASFAKEQLMRLWGHELVISNEVLANTVYSPEGEGIPDRLKIIEPDGTVIRLYRTTTRAEGREPSRTVYALSRNGQDISDLTWFDVTNLSGLQGKNDSVFPAIRLAFENRKKAAAAALAAPQT